MGDLAFEETRRRPEFGGDEEETCRRCLMRGADSRVRCGESQKKGRRQLPAAVLFVSRSLCHRNLS
jgi:hypothetical protein